MLFTEAAEGGAGVLSRLVEALAAVARRALEIIHIDPDTGADLQHAPGARERCEKGCYDCLLSYSNQYEHAHIDRHTVVDLLRDLCRATVPEGAGGRERTEQREWLNRLSESGLERRFVEHLDEHGFRLPDDAQRTVEGARPDFIYTVDGSPVAIFIDGPHHDDAHQQGRDDEAAARLENAGWTVVRIRYDDDWPTVLRQYSWIFGPGRTSP